MDVDAVPHELQRGKDPALRLRRGVAAIAAGLAAELAILGMAQYGAIRRVPDLHDPRFDSNRVIQSRAAYPFGIPDTALAVTGCGAIIALATAGGSVRTGRPRVLDWALAAATCVGAGGAVYYLAQMRAQRRLCAYCLGTAAGLVAMVPLAFAAIRRRA